MSKDKLGPYIQSLMTTVLDKDQDQFVIDLAWSELKRLQIDLEEFLGKHEKDDSEDQPDTEITSTKSKSTNLSSEDFPSPVNDTAKTTDPESSEKSSVDKS